MTEFQNFTELQAVLSNAPEPLSDVTVSAKQYNEQLTKPLGSLGRLEDLAIWYAGWRGIARPYITNPQIIVFAGNHGVAKHGVSAFPAEVTAQMVENFKAGGAAINQLAKVVNAKMDIYPLFLNDSTNDFTMQPAMSEHQCIEALSIGWKAVRLDSDLLVVGEMGIGNTTSAAAICCALFGGEAATWTGRGTGISNDTLETKTQVVHDAVARHQGGSGLEILARLGGYEVAAMAGAIACARMNRIPVVLDGFICTAAAACLSKIHCTALKHSVAGHVSAESGHALALDALGLVPILSLGMRLGEGSGAAVAVNVLRCALSCHSGMATFDEASVSKKQ